MDAEDDDIYPEYEPTETNHYGNEVKMEDGEEEGEEGEEVEDESDDDINFIIDAKDESKTTASSQSKPKNEPTISESRSVGTPQPAIKREHTPQPNINRLSTPREDGRLGADYPARHTSTLDPTNGNPVHPSTGKPIFNTDFDTDFPTESSKPWRKPGADITDYFNYGFDEFTWASYCLKKQQMPQEVKHINSEADQMKAFVEGIGVGGGVPGMPGMPSGNAPANGGMGQMPGMPNEQEMQQMFQTMMTQGIDPSAMDPNQFMSMMMAGGGGGPAQFNQGGQQPPSGPSGFGGNNYQEGFSGRGRGRRGRGNW